MHSSLEGQINDVLEDGNPVASENIQSRLRGIIVMALQIVQWIYLQTALCLLV